MSVTIGHGRAQAPDRSPAARLHLHVVRFYVFTIEPSLFGDAALVRAWGRMGSFGRERLDLYESAGEAGEALEAWLARKIRRGDAPEVSKVITDGPWRAAPAGKCARRPPSEKERDYSVAISSGHI
jgi:predicted DNA-binding WGR domain protein